MKKFIPVNNTYPTSIKGFLKPVLPIALFFTSCTTGKMLNATDKEMIAYNKQSIQHKTTIGDTEYKIKQDDKLSLSVWNNDDISVGSLFGIYNSNEVYGKWIMIDKDGNGIFPSLGKVHIAGLTAKQASDSLALLYSKEIKNPIVVARVLNMQVTVLGEVKNPGNYILDKQNNTLFEILGRSGGTNYYADARKITIQRGNPNNPEVFKVDISKLKNLSSAQLMLQPDDVVYVPSRNRQQFDKEIGTYVAVGSILTTLVVLLSR